jgi:redox-sensing transcriptional repressor
MEVYGQAAAPGRVLPPGFGITMETATLSAAGRCHMTPRSRIPRPTVKRLSLYLRELERLSESGQRKINSQQLGNALGITDAQVRKDLGFFGQFGHAGIGYRVDKLIEQLRKIFGTDRQWNAAVIGAGNLGRAVMAYPRFRRKGFDVVAVFDNNPDIIGTRVADHTVRPMEDLPKLVKKRAIKIGILAVPATAAQQVADTLIDAGITGILNFAPLRIDVHEKVSVTSVDFSIALEQLAFQVSLGLTGALDERAGDDVTITDGDWPNRRRARKKAEKPKS